MTKIDIISGFLGAGKTTFIKKMIDEAFKGEQIVLIEMSLVSAKQTWWLFKGCRHSDY